MMSLFAVPNLTHEELLKRMAEIEACDQATEFIIEKGYDLWQALYSQDCPPWWMLWFFGYQSDQPGYPSMDNLKLLLIDCALSSLTFYHQSFSLEQIVNSKVALEMARYSFSPDISSTLRASIAKAINHELETRPQVLGVKFAVRYALDIEQEYPHENATVVRRFKIARLHDSMNALPIVLDDGLHTANLIEAVWRDEIRKCIVVLKKGATLSNKGVTNVGQDEIPESLADHQPGSPT